MSAELSEELFLKKIYKIFEKIKHVEIHLIFENEKNIFLQIALKNFISLSNPRLIF
jgi:hypothetical protein